MKCRNHPDVDAYAVIAMPAAVKQPDGSYSEDVPFCAPCTDRTIALGFDKVRPVDRPPAVEITDEDIMSICAEHITNVLQGVVAAGVSPQRALKCASRALVELDMLAAHDQHRDLWAAPAHGSAITGLDLLDAALLTMKVQSPGRIDGYSLAEMYGRMLAQVRASVEQHWKMLEKGGGPRLIKPGENGFPT